MLTVLPSGPVIFYAIISSCVKFNPLSNCSKIFHSIRSRWICNVIGECWTKHTAFNGTSPSICKTNLSPTLFFLFFNFSVFFCFFSFFFHFSLFFVYSILYSCDILLLFFGIVLFHSNPFFFAYVIYFPLKCRHEYQFIGQNDFIEVMCAIYSSSLVVSFIIYCCIQSNKNNKKTLISLSTLTMLLPFQSEIFQFAVCRLFF